MSQPVAAISVIVSTRNRADSLRLLLASLDLIDAPGVPYEVVVADNDSDDDTPRVLREWREGGNERVTLRVLERGKSRALNAAIAASRGEVLAFLDDDVLAERRWLAEIWHHFASHDCVAAQGAVLWPPAAEQDPALRARLERYGTLVRIEHPADSGRARLTGINIALRRHTLAVVGGFDVRLGPGASGHSEDFELSTRIRKLGGQIDFIPGARVRHQMEPTLLTDDYFRAHHRRVGRSRYVHKRNSLLFSILPNLALAALAWAAHALSGNRERQYRAHGRLLHYGEMLRLRWRSGQGPG